MPELPEIYTLALQMKTELVGKKITGIEVRQEKCLNVPVSDFTGLINGKTIDSVSSRGKWIFVKLDPDVFFLLSLGMGGNVVYHKPGGSMPEKYQLKFDFSDGTSLTIGFWWFGYAHAVRESELKGHKMTASLGVSPLDDYEFTHKRFESLLAGKKGGIKSFLMDQDNIAGIGNVYIQDILFKSRLHPNRKIPQITEDEKKKLFRAIVDSLGTAAELGGLAYEKDLYDRPGKFKDFLVGYKEGKPCPECGSAIVKIKTGSTASFICPDCQK